MKINMIGGGFQHSQSSSDCKPMFVEWVKNNHTAEVSFYIDLSLMGITNPNTKNYAWLCESKTIIPGVYNWCFKNYKLLEEKFIKVFTHDVELSKLSSVFVLTQCSGKSIIKYDEHLVYEKSKLVSIISSNKGLCNEHNYRKKIIDRYKNKCDLFGRGFNPIENKLIGLKDYCFSFAMENATYPNMFTEKITDCFVTGTVPIYYGMKEINKIFNEKGIIFLDDNFDFNNLSFDLYNSMKPFVLENFEIARNILTSEDYIYINYLKKFDGY